MAQKIDPKKVQQVKKGINLSQYDTSVAKKIVYEGIEFESQAKLAKYLNKSRSYITKLIKQNKL